MHIPGYEISEKLYEGKYTSIYRAKRIQDNLSVIVKISNEEYPTKQVLDTLHNEYDRVQNLGLHPNIIQHIELISAQPNGLALIQEDINGKGLHRLLDKEGLSLEQFLTFSVLLAQTLAFIHDKGIIHRDIKPQNIIINVENNCIKYTDFGLATDLEQEVDKMQILKQSAGTLAYLSPEQTGRMNRTVDYRTDFYSLGITFYQMLTGQPPFVSIDPLEIVHSHIAKIPTALHILRPEIPLVLSNIISKLLEKEAENRYQNAHTLWRDLQQCLKAYQISQTITSFVIAQNDFSSRFTISHKLYGRDNEAKHLLDAFDAISEGEAKLLLVAGYSGIGKSSLINELYKPITLKKGYFLSGKFDQLDNTAYGPLADALSQLIRQLLTESKARLSEWKNHIIKAVGENGQLLIELIPELEFIIGPQPPVQALSGVENQHRFNLLFLNFLKIFCQAEHPIVLCLDDLQWADMATLNLLEFLLQEQQLSHLLFIGAYRDNEVNDNHPTRLTLRKIQTNGFVVESIHLLPLSLVVINEWLSDTLHQPLAITEPLAALVYKKTEGNPFFVKTFLHALYREKHIYYNPEQGWIWDLTAITQQQATDNVVEFMVHHIGQLDQETQAIIKVASCIGNRVNLNFLAQVVAKDVNTCAKLLEMALKLNFLFQQNEEYRFAHDRIQEAAYSLLTSEQKCHYHYQIGKLIKNKASSLTHEELFECVNHFNKAAILTVDEAEKIELVQLNIEAGKKAKAATAYLAARDYLQAALSYLSLPEDWQNQVKLVSQLHQELAEIEYLNGNFVQMDPYIDAVLEQLHMTSDPLAVANLYHLRISHRTLLANFTEAIHIGRDALRFLGFDIADLNISKAALTEAFQCELAQVQTNLKGRTIASLIDLPSIEDAMQYAAMKILVSMGAAAYLTNVEYLGLVTAKIVNISLCYGHAPESCYGYAFHGVSISGLGRYQDSYAFGRLALDLSYRLKDKLQQCRVTDIFVNGIQHWGEPLKNVLALCESGYQAGLASGELQYAGYNMYYKALQLFYQGEPLPETNKNLDNILHFVEKTQNQLARDIILAVKLAVNNLCGDTENENDFSLADLTENQFFQTAHSHKNTLALAHFPLFKAQALYHYGYFKEALSVIENAQSYHRFVQGFFAEVEYNWYHSLILIALYNETSEKDLRQTYWQMLEKNQQQMKRWSDTYAPNFQFRYLLVQAEMAQLQGKEFEKTVNLYEQAIEEAIKHGFIHHQALANELTAKFWLAKNLNSYAQLFINRAINAYDRWGIKHKVAQLQHNYANLIVTNPMVYTVSRMKVTPDISLTLNSLPSLDLLSLIRMSQIISSEVNLEKLFTKIMDLVIQTTGAQSGTFFTQSEDELIVVVEYLFSRKQTVIAHHSMSHWQHGSLAVVEFVQRTKNSPLLLEYACKDKQFAHDNYIKETQAKSILCVPVIQQGQLKGILYLENNLVPKAFTQSHLDILTLLASQMAISIQNAQYFKEQVKSARELAEQTTRAESAEVYKNELEQFVANICHELRSPSQGILGNLELLETTQTQLKAKLSSESITDNTMHALSLPQLVGEMQDYIDAIKISVKHQLAISNKVLELSKLEAGKVEIIYKLFKPYQTIHDVVAIFKASFTDKLKIVLDILAENTLMQGDEEKIKQILINLLSNAIKFTPQGEIKITCNYIVTAESHYQLNFSVQDTGFGMTQEQQEHLFQRFSQVSRQAAKLGGSGLGLSICKILVELLGGSINVQSEKDKGTCFYFSVICQKPDLTTNKRLSDEALINQPVQTYTRVKQSKSSSPLLLSPKAGATNQVSQLLIGGGTMGDLIRAKDWSHTAIGSIENWPSSLVMQVNTCLNSKFPFLIWWGTSLTAIYNDGYIPLLAGKHPSALGKPGQEVWGEPEVWEVIGPMLNSVIEKGEATWSEDGLLLLHRNGYLEETYFTWSYSPIFQEANDVGGILTSVFEVTNKVLSERRLKTTRELSGEVMQVVDKQKALALISQVLAKNPADLPFVLIYLRDEVNKEYLHLKANAGINPNEKSAPLKIALSENVSSFHTFYSGLFASVLDKNQLEFRDNVQQTLGNLPAGPWPESAHRIVALPLIFGEPEIHSGVMVAGLSPRLAFDEKYKGFIELVAHQIATALQNAVTFDAEKKRVEQLAEIDRAKTKFFSNVSHEFRTPLALMLGPLADSLADKEHPLSPTQKDRQILVQRNALRLLKLVNTILDFSRIEVGRAQACFTPTNLSQLTQELSNAFESLLKQAGLALVLDIETIDEPVYVDTTMWEKIILNLLSNAYKFTFHGHICVSLKIAQENIDLRVSDTGVGIPQHELPRMFERFHRIEGSRGRSFEGSGIGLALVHELVKLHGGTIDVQSQENIGTSFIITVPRGKAHLPSDKINENPMHSALELSRAFIEEAKQWTKQDVVTTKEINVISTTNHTSPSLITHENSLVVTNRARILLADDNADMRRYIKNILSSYWQVEIAEDGEIAYQQACHNPPDLILSDVMMPKMDGFELIKQLRGNPKTQRIPIILLSARAGEEAKVEGLNQGADDYLVKTSFSANELLARVKNHLELGQLRAHLEQEVEKSTAELRQLNTALYDFIDLLCHEIRNPLHGIIGSKDFIAESIMLIESSLQNANLENSFIIKLKMSLNDIKANLNSINECTQHQTAIMDEVILLSKIDSNKLELSYVSCKPRKLLNNVIKLFHDKIQSKAIKVRMHLDDTETLIAIDVERVKQVLANLLGYILDHIKSGDRLTLTQELLTTHSNQNKYKIGILCNDLDFTESLFKVNNNQFIQINKSLGKHYDSSNAGLIVSNKLVKMMGGKEITVIKKENNATEFVIELDYKTIQQEKNITPVSSFFKGVNISTSVQVSDALIQQPLERKKILIAEDNEINQKLLLRLLEKQGYECEVANNGKEAVAACEKQVFNLIFMDIEMPKMNGFEATSIIRASEKTLQRDPVIIIGLSAHAQLDKEKQAKNIGMNDYITKPIHANALYQLVDKWLVKQKNPVLQHNS